MAIKGKLTERVKQLSDLMTELEGDATNSKEIVADLKVKFNATEKRAEDVAYKRDSLRARLRQSQRGRDQMGESVTHIQDKIDRFSAGLKEDQEYMKS